METNENKGGFLQAVLDLFKNKNFILMMLISTVNTAGQVFVKTPTSLFGKESLGMTGMQLGMITGTYYLICTIFRPITGPLIDKIQQKESSVTVLADQGGILYHVRTLSGNRNVQSCQIRRCCILLPVHDLLPDSSLFPDR